MINIPPIKSSSSIKAELISDPEKTWRVGQILSATTAQGGRANSLVLIQLGQQILQARTPLELKDGQQIKLLVKHLGNAQLNTPPLLQIVDTQPEQEPAATTPGLLATQKLRQFIASQSSFSQLLKLSEQLLKAKLPPDITRTLSKPLNQLQQIITAPQQPNLAANIKQALQNSGLFYESTVFKQLAFYASTQNVPPALKNTFSQDIKHQLLSLRSALIELNIPTTKTTEKLSQLDGTQLNQLAESIKLFTGRLSPLSIHLSQALSLTQLQQLLLHLQSPGKVSASDDINTLIRQLNQIFNKQPAVNQARQTLVELLQQRIMLIELAQQVDQAISRISSQQLQPLSREADGLVQLLFNFVFKAADEAFDIQLYLNQQKKTGNEKDKHWTISLIFNFKSLGQVQAVIQLYEDRVSTHFHSEYSATHEKINQLLPQLESALSQAGFSVSQLSSDSQLQQTTTVVKPTYHLLDENI